MKSYSLDCGTTITKDKRNNNNKQSNVIVFESLSPSPCMDFAKTFETICTVHTHFLDNERAKAKPYFSLFQHDDTTTK